MNSLATIQQSNPDYAIMVELAAKTVAKSSARQYRDAYKKYQLWCDKNNHPVALSVDGIHQFLIDQPVTRQTRRRYMAALRKLAEIQMLSGDPRHRALYDFMKKMRVPTEGEGGKERNKVALNPAQVERLIQYWQQEPEHLYQKMIHARNRAAVYLGIATGCRRFEVVVFQWRDVNIADGTMLVRHGKGDKEAEVAIIGDFGVNALIEWQMLQGEGYQHIFTPMDKGIIEADRAMSTDTYYNAVKAAVDVVGIDFATHDLRRTLITELLRMKFNVRDVQAQARHVDPGTTMGYATALEAAQRKKEFKVRWGE